jgi:hypothetical protein
VKGKTGRYHLQSNLVLSMVGAWCGCNLDDTVSRLNNEGNQTMCPFQKKILPHVMVPLRCLFGRFFGPKDERNELSVQVKK